MAENADNKEQETKDTNNKSSIMKWFLWKDRVKSMADKQKEHRQRQKEEEERKKKEEESKKP